MGGVFLFSNFTDSFNSVTGNRLAKDVKTTDWYAQPEVGRRQSSSNYLEGRFSSRDILRFY
jgi:hypothetical protein